MVPALRFVNWEEAEQYFRAKEADQAAIDQTSGMLQKTGLAVITVV